MENQNHKEAIKAMTVSVMKLISRRNLAFDTSVLLSLTRNISEDEKVTIKIEGTNIYINPSWFMPLSENDRQWWLRHEVWHAIGMDEVRVGDKDPERWNLACDLWINNMLASDSGFDVRMPDDAVYMKEVDGMSKDQIYEMLEQNPNKEKQQQNKNDPTAGDCGGGQQPDQNQGNSAPDNSDGDDNNDSGNNPSQSRDNGKLEKELQNLVAQAAIQAKQAGAPVPPSVEQYLEELYNPKLNWNKILQRYMTSYDTHDYSYARFNKKMLPHGFILPTMYSEGMGPVMFATDESCSVTDEEFKNYVGAITNVKTRFNPERVDVLAFTTRVERMVTIEKDEEIEKQLNFRGHGGTHIPAVFDYIEQNKLKPQVLIVFSDMESALPTVKPNFDTIWISVNNRRFKAPFGRSIYIEV